MTYRQDDTPRTCQICLREIAVDELMLELFREESSREDPKETIQWVHEDCARIAIEKWLRKKRSRDQSTGKIAEERA